MKHFKLLYLKEVRGEQDAIIGYVTMIMAFMAVMFVIALRWPGSSVLAIANLPAALLPLWFIYASFDILSREWREKNIALLSSIPVQTHHVLGAKLAVVWTEYLFLSLLSSGTLLLITLTAGIPVSFPATFSEITGFIAGPFLILLPITPIAFLIYLGGVSFSRWPTLSRLLCVLVLSGVFIIIEQGLAYLFPYEVVKYSLAGILSHPQLSLAVLQFEIMPLSFALSLYVVAIPCFYAAGRLMEKYVLP
ncbi:MAG: hypothetical protein GX244_07630 [Firmicutes bacterium]|jgi:hypothetical protein|nr:hypothetical protein [Bacillota bacterium]